MSLARSDGDQLEKMVAKLSKEVHMLVMKQEAEVCIVQLMN